MILGTFTDKKNNDEAVFVKRTHTYQAYLLKYCILLGMIGMCLLVLAGLAACKPRVQPAAVEVVPPMKPCQLLEAQRKFYADTLLHHHIMVVSIGETMRIIIPDDIIFPPYSANLYLDQSEKLNIVAKLIGTYRTELVRINAFMDDQVPGDIAHALTVKQVHAVRDYLQVRRVDTRMIATQAGGSDNPVASNVTWDGRFFNRRIEITFRVYTPSPMY